MSMFQELILTFVALTTLQAFRYFVFAGAAFFLVKKVKALQAKPMQPNPVKKADILRDIKYSVQTVTIYGLMLSTTLNPYVRPYTKIYMDVNERGIGWIIFCFVLLFIIHDTYFYWMHKTLHLPFFFKRFHRTHHLSTNPTSMSSQAFHPVEAFAELFWFFPVVFILPMHVSVPMGFSLMTFLYNIYAHSHFELAPDWLLKSPYFKWFNPAINHNIHHKRSQGNYGLYFTFWDKVMKTHRK
ncbi:sterol desaturase family protein [Bdellovibrio sp. HCB337]|uniref:sterol desaturase family protein n=1 Tax=Bdellovibrio sp. HCB337 TaxID=3394358 RepID=UPI0039A6CE1A